MLTLLISVVILWHIRGDIGPILRMLMLGAPAGIDDPTLRRDVLAVAGVTGLHHLHVWQIDERRMSAELHLVVADGDDPHPIRHRIKARLAELDGTVIGGSPADFGQLIAQETEKWHKVISLAHIKAE